MFLSRKVSLLFTRRVNRRKLKIRSILSINPLTSAERAADITVQLYELCHRQKSNQPLPLVAPDTMFARTALRTATKPTAAFTASRIRLASTFSAAKTDAMNPHGVEISQAQRIAQQGFVSGTPPSRPPTNPPRH